MPMTASLPVNIPSLLSISDGITNEGFIYDETVSGIEKTSDPEISEEIFSIEGPEEDIVNSLETKLEKNGTEEKSSTEQISALEDKVLVLEEANRQLTERVINWEVKNQTSAEALFNLLLMLQELVKEEEGKEEKTGTIEVLINFLVFFMKEMFIPKDENTKTQVIKKVEPNKKAKVPSERVLEILELLKNESAQQSFKTPHIEKQAA